MRRSRPALVLLAFALLAAACTSAGGEEGPSAGPGGPSGGTGTPTDAPPPETSARALARAACENVARDALVRTWRGVRLDRSGDIQIVPRDPNFVNGGLTHATPFDYSQDVPLLLYGPGYVRPGEYDEHVTLADLAPTLGALLKFPFDAPNGTAQTQALVPEDARAIPALIVTIIWDSVGDNVLEDRKSVV